MRSPAKKERLTEKEKWLKTQVNAAIIDDMKWKGFLPDK